MRTIKWLPDVGNILKISASDDINLEQFMALLIKAGGTLDLNKNLVTEKVSKATFLTPDAILPNGDITLFSVIKNPKGNSIKQLDRKSIYNQIKKFVDRDGQRAKNFFNSKGNYTRVTTEELAKLVARYTKKPVTKTKATLPKGTTVAASKSKNTPVAKKRVSREEAEARAAQKSFRGNIYNRKD